MRSLLLSTASLLAAAAPLEGQSFQTPYSLWPGFSQLTSRGGLGNGAGELLAGFPTNVVRGIGTSSCTCRLVGIRTTIQSSNPVVATPFAIVFRTGSDATGPGTTNAAVLASVPATFPAAGTNPVAYVFTVSFSSPLAVPCTSFLAAGISVPARGPSLQNDLAFQVALPGVGTRAHPNADDVSWEIPAGATVARHPFPPQLLAVELLLDTPTLEAGNIAQNVAQPIFGFGGAFPNTTLLGAASQGLALRCRSPGGAQDNVAVIAGWGFDPAPFSVPGVLNDCVFIDRSTLISSVIATGQADGSPIGIAPQGANAVPSLNGASIVWQGVVVGSTLRATNAVATVLN